MVNIVFSRLINCKFAGIGKKISCLTLRNITDI
jgi:hypothetical protein